jgi:hypothetical protein
MSPESVDETVRRNLVKTALRVLQPLDRFAQQCHAAALMLVRDPRMPEGRVARGYCDGVWGQHSWMVVGSDCYDPRALIIDPTLWSYDESVEGIWVGRLTDRPKHSPHHDWSFWVCKPERGDGPDIPMEHYGEMSRTARAYMDAVLPLDFRGWCSFWSHVGVLDWPAAEAIEAVYAQPNLRGAIPIDLIGMLTDLNPGGLYLKEGGVSVPSSR